MVIRTVAYDEELANRVREALADHSPVREVGMFGGLAFMLDEKMVVSVRSNDELLLRVDPGDADDLLERGAQLSEMGTGRSMGKGWLTVTRDHFEDEREFAYWMGVALDYNRKQAAPRSGSRGRRKKS